MLREQRREQRRERRCGRWRALWRLRKAEGSRATSPETHPASGPRTATTKESGFPADSPRAAARVMLRSACVRASARGAPPPRRSAGARVERGSGARGATDRTREEARRRRRRARSARTPLFDCGGEEPPGTHARRARRARVTSRSARAAPSLRTERRPKRRRETRTTSGDGTREEPRKRRAEQGGGLVRCLCQSAVSSCPPRSSIRARRSLAPLPAPAAGGWGAPTSGRAWRAARGARSAGAWGSARRALSVSPRSAFARRAYLVTPRSSIRVRRTLAPLPAPAAGGRGAPTSGRGRRAARGARSAGARGSARRAHAARESPCSTAAVTNHR